MKLQKTTRSSLAKQIIEQLELLIVSGEWRVGERIPPEPELVEQLGVSRNTIREAVQALIHAGILEAKQGDGTYVRSSSPFEAAMLRRLGASSTAEIMEVRSCLEREIASLAAHRRTDADLAIIQKRFEARNQRYDNTELWVQADIDFHLAIAQAAHNSILIDLYKHLSEHIYLTIRPAIDVIEFVEQHTCNHRALVEAIAAQDAKAAEDAVNNLIQTTQNALAHQEKGSAQSEKTNNHF